MGKPVRIPQDLVLPCSKDMAVRLATRRLTYDAAAGQALFYSGHTPVGLFVLRTGQVRLVYRRRAITARAPALLGLPQFLECRPYPATAQVSVPARVTFVPRGVPRTPPNRSTADRPLNRRERASL